jgi:hypothetical protein
VVRTYLALLVDPSHPSPLYRTAENITEVPYFQSYDLILVSLSKSMSTFTTIYRLSASSTRAAPLIGASSICQYKDGSRIREASVSAKNASMCRTRVLPSSGLCWTVICQPIETLIRCGVLPSINAIPIPFGEPAILSAERRHCVARSIPTNIREARCPPARQPTQG